MIAAKKLMMVGGGLTDADAKALIARMSPAPNPTRQRAINNLVVALKNAGVWVLLKHFYVLAAHNQQAALLNWKGSSDTLSVAGTPPFSADAGFMGSASGRVSLGLDIQNLREYCYGTFVSFSQMPPEGQFMCGFERSGSSNRAIILNPNFSSGRYNAAHIVLGNPGATPPDDTAARADYFISGTNRRGVMTATENGRFVGNDVVGTSTEVGPAVGAGGFGVNYVNSSGSPSTGTVPGRFRATWIGQALTIAQTNALRAALTTYLQKIGAIA